VHLGSHSEETVAEGPGPHCYREWELPAEVPGWAPDQSEVLPQVPPKKIYIRAELQMYGKSSKITKALRFYRFFFLIL